MKKKILTRILQFEGDMSASFEFIDTILEDVRFRTLFNPDAVSDPLGSFTNIIRNYRQKGLIHPIQKDGRKLLLDGRNILQFLLIQRFLWLGSNLNRLQPISNLADDDLQQLVMATEVNISDLPEPIKSTTTPASRALGKNLCWHHFKMANGVMLQIQSEKYDPDQIMEIRLAVKESLNILLK